MLNKFPPDSLNIYFVKVITFYKNKRSMPCKRLITHFFNAFVPWISYSVSHLDSKFEEKKNSTNEIVITEENWY